MPWETLANNLFHFHGHTKFREIMQSCVHHSTTSNCCPIIWLYEIRNYFINSSHQPGWWPVLIKIIQIALFSWCVTINISYANQYDISVSPTIPLMPTHFIPLFHAFVVQQYHHSHTLDTTHFYFMSIHSLVVL